MEWFTEPRIREQVCIALDYEQSLKDLVPERHSCTVSAQLDVEI